MDGRGRRRFDRESKRVLIGIQARSTSTRLPNKINLDIAGRTILERVADSCLEAAAYLNRNHNRYGWQVSTCVLTPANDPISTRYGGRYRVQSFTCAEEDVLSRYVIAGHGSDYIVRITADCVFTAPYLVSRCIKTALFGELDYVSNVMVRTFKEGLDVEVMSAKLLSWLDVNAYGPDREHVTSFIKNGAPKQFRVCHVMNDVDDSHIKTSIDTMEDYQKACAEIESLNSKRAYVLARNEEMA